MDPMFWWIIAMIHVGVAIPVFLFFVGLDAWISMSWADEAGYNIGAPAPKIHYWSIALISVLWEFVLIGMLVYGIAHLLHRSAAQYPLDVASVGTGVEPALTPHPPYPLRK